MFVSSFRSLPTARELNIASYVLLQNDRYIFKAFIFFFFQLLLYGNLRLLSFHEIYSLSGFLVQVSP